MKIIILKPSVCQILKIIKQTASQNNFAINNKANGENI